MKAKSIANQDNLISALNESSSNEGFLPSSESDNRSICDRIKLRSEDGHDFLSNFAEFHSLFQAESGNKLLEEFETLTSFTDIEGKLKSLFNKCSKVLKISIIGEITFEDNIQIIRELEKKVSRTNIAVLEVKFKITLYLFHKKLN